MSYTDSYIAREKQTFDRCLDETIRRIETALRPYEGRFDTIVVSGLSGVIPAAIYAHLHGKQIAIVRKLNDTTHGRPFEGSDYFALGSPYVVLDDFVASGRTMRRIFRKLAEHGYQPPEAVVLYRERDTLVTLSFDSGLIVDLVQDEAHTFTVRMHRPWKLLSHTREDR
jgi:adenine/guanine phosphoribosyltransferase-like PRPP-binding protein